MRTKGFTLIELLIAIMIITILASASFWGYGKRQKALNLQKETISLVAKVEEIRERAISARYFKGILPQGGYGIFFNNSDLYHYILFADCNGDGEYSPTGTPCNGHSEFIERIELQEGVYLKSLPSPKINITYKPPSPEVTIKTSIATSSEITITLAIDNPYQEKTVYFNSAGLIYVQP
jgi:prepilin-type N-terminal cleavage/methylation domain-containing protein